MVRTSCCFKTIMLIHPAHYQFSVINYPFSDALLNSHPSPPQPAGLRNCNAAAFASFWKFAAPFSKYRLRRYRSKRGGLCNYWWKCENRLEIFLMPLLVLLTNNRSWRHAYPLLKLYCLNASHVDQKTNMGLDDCLIWWMEAWWMVNCEWFGQLAVSKIVC